MLHNPIAQPLSAPVAITLAVLFGVGLIGIIAAVRGDLARLRRSTLFVRWRTWAAIAPIYALAVLSGPVATLLLATALAAQALREFSALVRLPSLYRQVLLGMGLLILPFTLVSAELYFALPPLLLIVATLQPLLTQNVQSGARNLAFSALGFAYLPWLLGFLVLIQTQLPGGEGLLLILALGVALSDIGAFTAGSRFGRHRLSPILSPSKTWEGTIGNVLGAMLGSMVLWFAYPDWMPGLARLGLPLVLAIAALWGDLVESLLKREFAVKDAGDWLPGFGGLLDRIDSLLLAAPLTYYYCACVRWLV